MRPSIGDGAFREDRGGGDEFTADVAVEDSNLDDRQRIGDSNRHGAGKALCTGFVGDHERDRVNAGRGERVGDLWAIAKGAVGEGPIPYLDVG